MMFRRDWLARVAVFGNRRDKIRHIDLADNEPVFAQRKPETYEEDDEW